MGGSRAQKADYFEKLRALLNEYNSLFIVGYFPHHLFR
jgi:ribosomal protein L10